MIKRPMRPFQSPVLFAVTLLCSLTYCQTQAPAAVTFTIDFPNSQPEHYSIRVPSEGSGHYQSQGHLSADSDEIDSFGLDFSITSATRDKIFALAAKAGYFQKDIASHHKGMAFTGDKTLSYHDAQRNAERTYNFSDIPAVQELTSLLQNLSATLEFGHRLQYDHHYQKLALDEELKHMEDQAHRNDLIEIAAIQSVLDQIIADPTVINVTRARAQRLLERANAH
jgi:hypothetical protein